MEKGEAEMGKKHTNGNKGNMGEGGRERMRGRCGIREKERHTKGDTGEEMETMCKQ